MNNASLKKVLDVLNIPLRDQAKILLCLNESLGYGLYARYLEKFKEEERKKLKELFEKNKPEELTKFVLKHTNKKELQKIVREESEKLIKEFLQGYMKVLNDKQREEVTKRISTIFP